MTFCSLATWWKLVFFFLTRWGDVSVFRATFKYAPKFILGGRLHHHRSLDEHESLKQYNKYQQGLMTAILNFEAASVNVDLPNQSYNLAFWLQFTSAPKESLKNSWYITFLSFLMSSFAGLGMLRKKGSLKKNQGR